MQVNVGTLGANFDGRTGILPVPQGQTRMSDLPKNIRAIHELPLYETTDVGKHISFHSKVSTDR